MVARQRTANPAGPRRRALAYLEPLASIGLTVALAVLFSAAVVQYAGLRRQTDARRECVLAATAELDLIRAGRRDLPGVGESDSLESSAGAVTIRVTAEPGGGAWQGFTRVRVIAARQVGAARRVSVELAAYVPSEARP